MQRIQRLDRVLETVSNSREFFASELAHSGQSRTPGDLEIVYCDLLAQQEMLLRELRSVRLHVSELAGALDDMGASLGARAGSLNAIANQHSKP